MFRLIQHLLPRGLAWRTTIDTRLRQYLEGLAGLPTGVRTFVDLVFLDLFPSTTRELPNWEKQFALPKGGSEANRRLKLAAAWALQGSQSPDYIQRTIHAAGFPEVYLHEWWVDGPPRTARNPHAYTSQPLIGFYQCEAENGWECFDAGSTQPLAPHCDATLVNSPGYIVNRDLTRRAPPPVPEGAEHYPYFVYFGAQTFPERALVPASRIAELEEILLRICPTQLWIVLLVDPIDESEGFGSSGFGTAPLGA